MNPQSDEKDLASKRASFLDSIAGGEGHQFYELSRSMSAPPAEFLSSIQSVNFLVFFVASITNF